MTMILHLILGNNIDTLKWKSYIERLDEGEIACLDYEYAHEVIYINGLLYVSAEQAKKIINKYEKVQFYSSFYKYPLIKEDI